MILTLLPITLLAFVIDDRMLLLLSTIRGGSVALKIYNDVNYYLGHQFEY